MALYPTSPVPSVPYPHTDSFVTIRSGKFESGLENVRAARVYPLFSARLTYPTLTWTSYATLYAFFIARKGAHGTFTFKDFNGHDSSPVGIAWPKLYAYTATSTTADVTFDVPMASSSSFKLYDNGSEVTRDPTNNPPTHGQYYFLSGSGTDGRDQVKLDVTSGHVYEWEATGQRCVNARFDVDDMTFNSLYAALTSTGVVIVEAR